MLQWDRTVDCLDYILIDMISTMTVGSNILMLPLLLCWPLSCTGFGWMSALNVNIVTFATLTINYQLWMFLSPSFYPLSGS